MERRSASWALFPSTYSQKNVLETYLVDLRASGGNLAAHIILDLPGDSPLMLKSKDTIDEYAVSREAGEILFSVCNHQDIQILAIQFAVCDDLLK